MPPPKRLVIVDEVKHRESIHRRMMQIIRSVIINKRWLGNGDKEINPLVRTYKKIGILTKAEKALMRSAPEGRTVEERKLLVKLLAGLLCFSRLPPKLRARLVPCINFMNLGPNRKLINEGDEPQMLYFILTGEVVVSRRVYNPLEKRYEVHPEMLHGPGDCIGDVELIENCKRLNSYKTHTEVELLVVYADDFDRILRPYMSKEWFDKKRALKEFDYFQNFTEQQVISTCKISVIRQFDPLDNIYFEDKGQGTYVHFVLSGECMVLQFLKINVTEKRFSKTFDLVRILPTDNIFKELSNAEVMQMLREEYMAEMREPPVILDDLISDDDVSQTKKKMIRKMDIKTIEIECGLRSPSDEKLLLEKQQLEKKRLKLSTFTQYQKTARRSSMTDRLLKDTENLDTDSSDDAENGKENKPDLDVISAIYARSSTLKDLAPDAISLRSGLSTRSGSSYRVFAADAMSMRSGVSMRSGSLRDIAPDAISMRSGVSARSGHSQKSQGSDRSKQLRIDTDVSYVQDHKSPSADDSTESYSSGTSEKSSVSLHTLYAKDYTKRRENHFIDVGSLTYGAIFGLGEPLDHRVIMARTTVQCLMIPRFWLFERNQNPSNIWNRRRFYLENSLPSRENLFKNFLTTRNWQHFKSDYVRQEAALSGSRYATKPQDVPVYGRILQPNED